MGMLIAYLLGILSAGAPKPHHSNHNSDSPNTAQQHFPTDGPISVVCIPPLKSEEETTKEQKKEKREARKFWIELVSGFLLLGYVGVTILIWCANKKMAEDTHQSVLDAQRHFRIDERAWIGARHPSMTQYNRSPLKFQFIFFNSGKTPAVHVEVGHDHFTSSKEIDGPTQEQWNALKFDPEASVAPGGDYVLHQESIVQPFTAFHDGVRDSTIFAYFYGMVRYNDVFDPGTTRTTWFCYYIANIETGEIGFCKKGNDLN